MLTISFALASVSVKRKFLIFVSVSSSVHENIAAVDLFWLTYPLEGINSSLKEIFKAMQSAF